MAGPQRRLSWKIPDEAAVRKDFSELGGAGKAHLESILTADAFIEGCPDTTLINLGRQSLARQILQDSLNLPEAKIIKNVPDE
jgi:hypothetical protein